MGSRYFGVDLFDVRPDGFSESVTIAGLLNHGVAGYPVEWLAILSDTQAQIRLVRYFAEERPVDFAFFEKLIEVVKTLGNITDHNYIRDKAVPMRDDSNRQAGTGNEASAVLGAALADVMICSRSALRAAIVAELMDYFSDPRSAGISLFEYQGRSIASGILERVEGSLDPSDTH